MSATLAPARAAAATGALRRRIDGPAVAAWSLPFAAVLYLALERGGYDPIVRGEVGIAVWWIVLLGAATGALPAARLGRSGWVGLGLLVALAAWTALSLTWTESDQRTADELGKLATYAGLLALTLAVAARTSARHALDGLACAVALVALVAVLSRLQPDLFPRDDLPRFFGDSAARRLSYPLNYWNGLAAFVAMALPLVLRAAADARTLAMRAVAAGAVPAMALCVFLTVSRGGAVCVAIAAVVWLVLSPGRPAKLATLAVAGAGSAIVVAGADQRDALQSGLASAAATAEGENLLAMLVVVALGAAFLQIAVALVTRHVPGPRVLAAARGRAPLVAAAVAAVVAAAALAAGVPGAVDREWQQFKDLNPAPRVEGGEDAFARLESASGNGRYQYWQQAADAQSSEPLGGIGAGTFELWWARNATYEGGFIRDAHSLYMETFAELGLVGLALVGGLILLALGVGALRALARLPAEHRGAMAAATAGLAAFAASAAVEWIWDLPAIAAAALVLIAVVLAGGRRPRAHAGPPPAAPRAALAALAVAGLVAVAVPLAGASAVRDSEQRVARGDLAGALEKARAAASAQPYSATAHLQQALVFERAGAVEQAVAAARVAAAKERTNWRTWLVLSRLEAKAGRAGASVAAYRRARHLNPRSAIFR
jgi:O-Antigen ligase